MSDYNLSETERYVLAHGLEFCLPPSNIKREEVFAEFEILLSQLLHHKPKTSDELILLKAKLNEVAHSFCGSPIDTSKFSMDNSCLQAIKSLRSNKAILITKPDKGSGVVILNVSFVTYAEVKVVLLDLVELESENFELVEMKNIFSDFTTVV